MTIKDELIERNENLLAYLQHLSSALKKRGSSNAVITSHEAHLTTVRMTLSELKGNEYK